MRGFSITFRRTFSEKVCGGPFFANRDFMRLGDKEYRRLSRDLSVPAMQGKKRINSFVTRFFLRAIWVF
jgi:hypothetical protein